MLEHCTSSTQTIPMVQNAFKPRVKTKPKDAELRAPILDHDIDVSPSCPSSWATTTTSKGDDLLTNVGAWKWQQCNCKECCARSWLNRHTILT
eukprot:897092-Amphidinium_carterae.1